MRVINIPTFFFSPWLCNSRKETFYCNYPLKVFPLNFLFSARIPFFCTGFGGTHKIIRETKKKRRTLWYNTICSHKTWKTDVNSFAFSWRGWICVRKNRFVIYLPEAPNSASSVCASRNTIFPYQRTLSILKEKQKIWIYWSTSPQESFYSWSYVEAVENKK